MVRCCKGKMPSSSAGVHFVRTNAACPFKKRMLGWLVASEKIRLTFRSFLGCFVVLNKKKTFNLFTSLVNFRLLLLTSSRQQSKRNATNGCCFFSCEWFSVKTFHHTVDSTQCTYTKTTLEKKRLYFVVTNVNHATF